MRVANPIRRIALILSIVTSLVPRAGAIAEEPAEPYTEAAMFVGLADVANDAPPIEAGFELRRATKVRGLEVMAGLTATEESAAWVYGGARYAFEPWKDWFIAPSFALTLYEQGDGKDLGQTLQFRSALEVGRRISERLSIALGFYHLSNASMSEVNPGSNSLVLSFAVRKARRAVGLSSSS